MFSSLSWRSFWRTQLKGPGVLGQGCRPWLQFFATIEGWNAAGRGVSFGTFLRIAGRETAPSLGWGHPRARTPFTRENKRAGLMYGLAHD